MTRPENGGDRGLFKRIAGGATERALDLVDPNILLDHIDVDLLMQRIDLNSLLDRIDINQLLDRIDINQVLLRVDVDALLSRADIDALIEQVDVKAVVERAGVPEIVAQSTGHLTASALDLLRKPLVGLDALITRALNRLFRRDASTFPNGPSDLIHWVEDRQQGVVTGRYGGPLTRLLAVVIDAFVVTFGFTLITAGVFFLIGLVSDFQPPEDQGLVYGIVYVVWVFLYLWVSLAVFGKTIGKAVLGLRVVRRDGSPGLHKKEPFIRVLTYPLSFVLFGIGLLGVVFNPERRAWHDRFAGTVVVYDWGPRTAAMPLPLAEYLDRRAAPTIPPD